jgi:hypothetical protein
MRVVCEGKRRDKAKHGKFYPTNLTPTERVVTNKFLQQ